MQPPSGISAEQWQRARERAAEAEIARLSERGGFWPDRVRRAFANGWCDTSGKVQDFVNG